MRDLEVALSAQAAGSWSIEHDTQPAEPAHTQSGTQGSNSSACAGAAGGLHSRTYSTRAQSAANER
jgi:hypothetical protein